MKNEIANFLPFKTLSIEYIKGGNKGTVEGSSIRDGVTYMDIVWESGPPDCGNAAYAPPGGDSSNDMDYIGGTCYKP